MWTHFSTVTDVARAVFRCRAKAGQAWLLATALVLAARAESGWALHNEAVALRVESRGAVISSLRVPTDAASWLSSAPPDAPDALFGHFLCFDRWGPVTEAEAAAGIPYHGEAAGVPWTVVTQEGALGVTLRTTLPVVGLRAERSVHLPTDGGGFQITTTVANPLAETRPYNAVEHVTLADAWNDPTVRLSTNAQTGLVQVKGRWVEDADVAWPVMRVGGETWDLRGPMTRRGRLIASLVFADEAEWAWVCLRQPDSGRVLGYLWRTADYPWLNLYWHADGERVLGRAVEPGTTGLHRPMPELRAAPVRLGRPVVSELAPGASRTFGLWGFVAQVGEGFGEVVAVERRPTGWALRDDAGKSVPLTGLE